MNQSKFTLADVLTVLSSLAFGFICFLGANFLNINNAKVWGMPHTTGCMAMAVVCSLLLFATSLGAKLLKRTNRNFTTCFVWEVVFLALFILFAMFLATRTSPFTHYFTVKEKKVEIISNLQTSISQAEKMFVMYEIYATNRENLYKHKLQSVASAKGINPSDYANHGFDAKSGISDASQIETKMFIVHADLFPTDYSDTIAKNGRKEVAAEWLQEAKTITSSWKPIGIVGVVNEIEKNSHDWLNSLSTLSQIREQGEQTIDFVYPLSFDDVKTHFTKLESPRPLSIGLAVMAYILMLLSWIVTKRSTRFPGLKLLFGFGKSNDKEL